MVVTGQVPAVVPDGSETSTSGLESMSGTRRSILFALKTRGEARAEELAADLGVTVSATRQHLASLSSELLVEHEQLRDGRGRPRHSFLRTELADSLFPRNYAEITNELLTYVDEADHELLDKVFRRR